MNTSHILWISIIHIILTVSVACILNIINRKTNLDRLIVIFNNCVLRAYSIFIVKSFYTRPCSRTSLNQQLSRTKRINESQHYALVEFLCVIWIEFFVQTWVKKVQPEIKKKLKKLYVNVMTQTLLMFNSFESWKVNRKVE